MFLVAISFCNRLHEAAHLWNIGSEFNVTLIKIPCKVYV